MKEKRILFILFTLLIALTCFVHMNRSYDPLSRYPYEITPEEHETIVSHLDAEAMEYIIEYAIGPEYFMPYINCNHFTIYRIMEYSALQAAVPSLTAQQTVDYYHTMERLYGKDINDQLKNSYYVHEILDYYRDYPNAGPLLIDAASYTAYVDVNHLVGYYVPKDLVTLETGYGQPIVLRQEAADNLNNMLRAMEADETVTDMENFSIIQGYLSYQTLYDMASTNTPGTIDYQLGLSFVFDISTGLPDSKVYYWMLAHAYEYGFVQYSKEEPYHFRYVTKEEATKIHRALKTFKEVQ